MTAARRRPIAEGLEARQLLATLLVNTTGDADGADGGSTLSLRQAIEVSDGTLAISALTPAQAGLVVGGLSATNAIDFAIPGPGPFVIAPGSALPAITRPVVIDGYSQPGTHSNTNGRGLADDAVLLVEIDGAGVAPGADGLVIGSGGVTVRGLAIGGFAARPTTFPGDNPGGNGIDIVGQFDAATPALIQGNFLGTDLTGTRPLPDGRSGVLEDGGAATIGGTTPASRNILSGNVGDGLTINGFRLSLEDSLASDLVQGNFIGVDATGARPLANGEGLSASTNFGGVTVGGTASGAGNVISGNLGVGVSLFTFSLAASKTDLIEGNFLGTNAAGSRAIPNSIGIQIEEDYDGPLQIGGTAAGAGNVISGNLNQGIAFDGSGGLVQGNFIGTDASGSSPLPNDDGVVLRGEHVTIGGTAAGAGNVLSGNRATGLSILNIFERSDDLVQGNFLGVDATGVRPLGNLGDGLAISSSASTIGGTAAGAGNVIADNGGDGVVVFAGFFYNPDYAPQLGQSLFQQTAESGQLDTISGNSTFGNRGRGIDLLDLRDSFVRSLGNLSLGGNLMVTPGYPIGGNALLAAPRIVTATASPFGTSIFGTLAGTPSTTFAVELFADPDGSGQGRVYLGSSPATTDASGLASFAFRAGRDLLGQSITATATDPMGDTSEFAQPLPTRPSPSTSTTLVGSSPLSTVGQPLVFVAAVASTSHGVPTGLIAFVVDGISIGVEPLDASGRATFVTAGLGPGPHVVQATYLGDASDAPSSSQVATVGVLPTVAADGPTVTSLAAPVLGAIQIRFSRPLRIGTAQDSANYEVIGPDGHAVSIESAVYSPSDDSVTLSFDRPLKPHRTYRVRIDGERVGRVDDLGGIPLDGRRDGRPGSRFVGKVTTGGAIHGKPHPLARKSAHPTGKGRR